MTAQALDQFVFEGKAYALVESEGGSLACPANFGMKSAMTSTANRRGFSATYVIAKEGLELTAFGLRERDNCYLPINEIRPDLAEEGGYATYTDVALPMSFTGTIRIAKDWDQANCSYITKTPAGESLRFRTVLDLAFREGEFMGLVHRSGGPGGTIGPLSDGCDIL